MHVPFDLDLINRDWAGTHMHAFTASAIRHSVGQIYFCSKFRLAFVLLLMMNSVITHSLRKRSLSSERPEDQGQSESQGHKIKNIERKNYIMLWCATFIILSLNPPGYVVEFYVNYFNYRKSPATFVGYYWTDQFPIIKPSYLRSKHRFTAST